MTVTAGGFSRLIYLARDGEPLKNFGQDDRAKGVNGKKWENEAAGIPLPHSRHPVVQIVTEDLHGTRQNSRSWKSLSEQDGKGLSNGRN